MAGSEGARPHTGRMRNPQARRAVLDAVIGSANEAGLPSIDTIAERAGVGRQTIYRWWSSKSSLVLDAVVEAATSTAPNIRCDDARSDLERFVLHTFHSAGSPPLQQLLRQCVAEAVRDNEAALALQRFAAERRAILRGIIDRGVEDGDFQFRADADLLVEQVYGLLWYRLLMNNAPINSDAGRLIVDQLLLQLVPRSAR